MRGQEERKIGRIWGKSQTSYRLWLQILYFLFCITLHFIYIFYINNSLNSKVGRLFQINNLLNCIYSIPIVCFLLTLEKLFYFAPFTSEV